jgi:uncharacterized protein YgiM (DUF1202 family)
MEGLECILSLIGSGIPKEGRRMRKTILLLTLVFFVAGTAIAAARPRHYYRPHRSHHSHHYNDGAVVVGILGAIGLGLLVGATVERANNSYAPAAVPVYPPAAAPVYVPAYRPVAAPAYVPVSLPTAPRADTLVVTTPRLYVRSGPGMHHAVIGEVQMNNVLKIVGSADGWWRVHLYGGQYGWVMSDYTRLFSDPDVRG